MSQQYGRVDAALVVHHHFRDLSIDAKLLCLFLRATPRGNAVGCFYYPVSQIADDLGNLSMEGASKGLRELSERGYARYCETTRWVWIPKHLDHFPVRGRNSGKHALDVMETIPRDFTYSAELTDSFERNHDWAGDRESDALDRRWKDLRRTFEGASQPPIQGAHSRAAARGDLDPIPDKIPDKIQETTAGAAVGEKTDDSIERVPDTYAEILEWGVSHLMQKGPLARHTAQQFVAGMCKIHGEAAVARQLLALKLSPKVEPRSWLKSQLERENPHGTNRPGARRSAVDALLEANGIAPAGGH